MKILSVILCCLLLAGCAAPSPETVSTTAPPETAASVPSTTVSTEPPETEPVKDVIDRTIDAMSLEQRVGQLFLARCNKETVISDLSQYHLGGRR